MSPRMVKRDWAAMLVGGAFGISIGARIPIEDPPIVVPIVLSPVVVTDTIGAPLCISWHFADSSGTAFYETHCVGGARPDSVANPNDR